jgi:hypothetical protein
LLLLPSIEVLEVDQQSCQQKEVIAENEVAETSKNDVTGTLEIEVAEDAAADREIEAAGKGIDSDEWLIESI